MGAATGRWTVDSGEVEARELENRGSSLERSYCKSDRTAKRLMDGVVRVEKERKGERTRVSS